MKAYIFPGQGNQFPGMGNDLYENSKIAKEYFERANNMLGFSITDIMFEGTFEALRHTKVTQPAIFLHSYILSKILGSNFNPAMVAGHSTGEITALAVAGVLNFESALWLLSKRGIAMQEACELQPTMMSVVIGLEKEIVETVCKQIKGIVVPANYNAPKQVVISGDIKAVLEAGRILKPGATSIVPLQVDGAFHSPYMSKAINGFKGALNDIGFRNPRIPIYLNATGTASMDILEIKENLIAQLISPVLWENCIRKMISDGATQFIELGPGNFLTGLMRKIDRNIKTISISRYEHCNLSIGF